MRPASTPSHFFVLIVVAPIAAMGVLTFRLISDSQQGKEDARANGLASAATSVRQSESAPARADAEALARDMDWLRGRALARRCSALARKGRICAGHPHRGRTDAGRSGGHAFDRSGCGGSRAAAN